jgi:hypothetical protein
MHIIYHPSIDKCSLVTDEGKLKRARLGQAEIKGCTHARRRGLRCCGRCCWRLHAAPSGRLDEMIGAQRL